MGNKGKRGNRVAKKKTKRMRRLYERKLHLAKLITKKGRNNDAKWEGEDQNVSDLTQQSKGGWKTRTHVVARKQTGPAD